MQRINMIRLGLLALLWGSSFLWIKIALDGLSPVQIAFARLALGAAFLLTMVAAMRLRLPGPGRYWAHLTVIALVGQAVPFVLFGVGERTVSSGLAGVLNATTPLWTMIFALLAGQERRPEPLRVLGLGIGFGGTVLILAPWQGTGTLAGSLACIGAALCYGAMLVYSARFVIGKDVSPLALSAAQISMGAALLALATPVLGRQPVRLDLPVSVSITLLGLLGTGYAFVLLNRLIAEEGATSAATVTYLLPVIAVLLGAAVLSEELNVRVLAGMVVVLAGVMLTQRRRQVAPHSPNRPARVGGS